jgi:hypothetical protein
MKPKSVTVTVSKTIQVAQYEPLTIQIVETHDLESEDNPREVRSQLVASLSKSLRISMKKALREFHEEEQ